MPKNPQNNSLRQKRDCTRVSRTRSTFSKSLMTVSVGVSKLGQTQLIFVDPAVKIMMHTTVMCFSLNSYCLLCRRSRETSSSCSKTVIQCTAHATQSNFLNGRLETLAFIAPNLWLPIVQI